MQILSDLEFCRCSAVHNFSTASAAAEKELRVAFFEVSEKLLLCWFQKEASSFRQFQYRPCIAEIHRP